MTEPSSSAATGQRDLTVAITVPATGLAVVTVAGRLDAVTAPELRAALGVAGAQDNATIVFDLSALVSIDSAGLAVLIWTRRACRERGGDTVLVRPDSVDAMRVFRLTQFDQVFRILPSDDGEELR